MRAPSPSTRSRRRTLYIFVEVGSRELLSRLILAEEARRRGYRVVLGEKNLLRNLCWLFRAPCGIILDKCGQAAGSYPLRALKRRGFRYVVLDEEGLFFSHRKRLPAITDLMLFNSMYQRRLSGMDAPDGDVVGNPRLHPTSLLPYLAQETRWIRERYGEFVLVCSSFDPKMKSSYGLPVEAEADAKLREYFFEIVTRLARSVPLVYRPHPSDGEQFVARIAGVAPIERRFTILPWIAASRLVINAKCTSSFEALRLGVPSATLSLRHAAHAKLNGLSRRFYDVDSLCRYVESGRYSLALPKYKGRYVNAVCGPDEPVRRLVDRLDSLQVPEVGQFDLARPAAHLMSMTNALVYGRATTRYLLSKYGRHSYMDHFPAFIAHLGGRLILSRDDI